MGELRQRVRDIVRLGDTLFNRRYPVMSLWQTQAENFHVMRADFTRRRYFSEEFGSYLMSGKPARCHRDLTNSFSAMLRRDQWFHAQTDSEQVNEDRNAKIWLDWASKTMRRAMYDRRTQFVRSTKVADGDFCAFGNAVITRDVVDYSHFLFRCWHLRDVAWDEGVTGKINTVHFNWRPQARQMVERFKNSKTGSIDSKIVDLANRNDDQALKEINCRRFLLSADDYDLSPQARRGMPYVSVYVDTENETILEEIPLRTWPVTIPRFEFGSSMYGDQYGYSPMVVYGLPDSRMYQQMMLSMLTASEMATYPAMIAVGEAINGGINLYAAGITQVDADYDERTGDVLRPITTKFDGIEWGAQQMERLEGALADAFLLNRIQFPDIKKEMTAFEASKLWDQYRQQVIPLFDPVQEEYSTALCEGVFEDMLYHGAFGSVQDMPQVLRGRDISWQFDTPLSTAMKQALTGSFQATTQLILEGAQIDPTLAMIADLPVALRDAVEGTGAPAKWLQPEDKFNALVQQHQRAQQAAQAANAVATGADVATRVHKAHEAAGVAAQALQDGGMA